MTTDTHQLLAENRRCAERDAALEAPRSEVGAPPCRTRVLLAGSLTGALLWLCYFPVAWGWLGWVALVPFLVLARAEGPRLRIYLSAWVGGSLFFWTTLQWLRVADDRMYYTWAALAIYCSLYFPVAVLLLRVLDRRSGLPLVISAPAVWTALELLRAHLMTGFPWYFMGHTQHDFLHLTQIADLGGAYAVSVLVVAVNALVFEWLCQAAWFRKLFRLPETAQHPVRQRLIVQSLALLAAFIGTLLYGFHRLSQDDFAAGPRVALLQSNLDQRIRVAASVNDDQARRTIFVHNRELTDRAAAQKPKPDLIVWPETSYPEDWFEVATDVPDASVPREWRRAADETRELGRLAALRWKTNVMLGLNTEILVPHETHRRYNSAVLVQPSGQKGGRYDKMHRVPFGEYVPLVDWFPWMQSFAPYDHEYSIAIGDDFTRFPLGRYSFGVVICYEDTDPVLARQYVNDSSTVDFLVNISNDGWFDGTSEHEQHLAICRFRAIECRRAVVRAVNMGVSAVIDGNGRVLKPEDMKNDGRFNEWVVPERDSSGRDDLPQRDWQQYKKVAGILTATVPIDNRPSLYAYYGDWLPWLCWLIIGVGLVRACIRRQHAV